MTGKELDHNVDKKIQKAGADLNAGILSVFDEGSASEPVADRELPC